MRQHTSAVNARAALLPNLVALADGRAADAIEHCGPRGLASPTALPYVHAHPPSGPTTIARAVQSDPAAMGRRPCARQLVLVATSTAPAACIDLAARLRLASRRSPYRRARSRRRPGALACSSLAAALAARVVSFAVCLHVLAGHTHTFARTATCSPYDCDRPKDEDRHGRRELDRDRQLDSEIEQEPYGRDLNESQKQQTTQQIYYGPAEEFTASVGCYRNSQPPILLLPNKW
jgi:hypothetical protein